MPDPDTSAGFIEPSFESRLKLALLGAASGVVWLAMELWWSPFMAHVKALPVCEAPPWLRGISLGFVALFWLAAASAARAARLILQSGQSPFPSAWVWVRTRVRTGWRSRLDGWAMALVAAAFFAAPLVVAALVSCPSNSSA